MSATTRSIATLLVGSFLALACLPAPGAAAPSGPPVRIGSTLALTGPLAPNGIIHKIAGEIFVERITRRTGCSAGPSSGSCLTTSPSLTRPKPSTSAWSPWTRWIS